MNERLATLEAKDEAMAATLARLEHIICRMDIELSAVRGDVRDAKTSLRVGFWISSTIIPPLAAAAGWFSHYLWPFR